MLAELSRFSDSRLDYETRGNDLAMVATQSGLVTGGNADLHCYPRRSYVWRDHNGKDPTRLVKPCCNGT